MWENLIELTHLNSPKGSRVTSLIEGRPSGKDRLVPLYRQLLNGKLDKPTFDQLTQNDTTASAVSILQEELIHTYFFSNLERSGFNDRKSAEVECWKNWVAVKMLFGKSAMVFPQKACLKILKQAERYGFHKLIIEVAKQLRLYYGAQLGDSKRFKKYDDLIRLHKRKYLRVKKISRDLNALKLSLLLRSKNKKEILSGSNQVLKEASRVPESEQSFAFGYKKYLIMLIRDALLADLTATIQSCREAIQFTAKTLKKRQGNEDRIFHLVLAFSYMRQGDFSKASQVVDKLNSQEKKGTPLWFDNMAFKTAIALQAGHPVQAVTVLKEVKGQSKFKLLLPQVMEIWICFERYLDLLAEFGHLKAKLLPSPLRGQLGLTREEMVELEPESLFATHQYIIEAIKMDKLQDRERIKKVSSNLKAGLCTLREKGFYRIAAFAEFLSQSILSKESEYEIKEAYRAGRASWNDWPLFPDIQKRIFEEIIPFDRILEMLQEKKNLAQASNN